MSESFHVCILLIQIKPITIFHTFDHQENTVELKLMGQRMQFLKIKVN